MTVKECYEMMEGNYEEVLSRLKTDERIKKFILKFLEDPSFELLKTSLETKQYDEAFRAVHTLKGISQNLSFTLLYASSYTLTEKLRNREIDQLEPYVLQIKKDYERTIQAIQCLE